MKRKVIFLFIYLVLEIKCSPFSYDNVILEEHCVINLELFTDKVTDTSLNQAHLFELGTTDKLFMYDYSVCRKKFKKKQDLLSDFQKSVITVISEEGFESALYAGSYAVY